MDFPQHTHRHSYTLIQDTSKLGEHLPLSHFHKPILLKLLVICRSLRTHPVALLCCAVVVFTPCLLLPVPSPSHKLGWLGNEEEVSLLVGLPHIPPSASSLWPSLKMRPRAQPAWEKFDCFHYCVCLGKKNLIVPQGFLLPGFFLLLHQDWVWIRETSPCIQCPSSLP